MLLLGIDTSGKSGGLTLAEGDRESFQVLGSASIAGGTFSAQLIPTLATLLHQHGRLISSIDGFAPISGPGSFTGLRVGLSAVKGLAEILKKPIAPVSLLEVLAALSSTQGKVATALDAGREEVFFGLYLRDNAQTRKLGEQLLTRNQFLQELCNSEAALLVTSDHSIATIAAERGVTIREVERPGSEAAARIGLGKLLAGETVSVEALDANYIRRSDAEIAFKC
ncbi:MAG TPA: tRNA (adenosine(37)-N6)-threonylcarbamoyltransferase complex dimerization subunit type 1 TsaB [Candidatus Angelobacter sp.]|nr:tRNA (adenosine(37)-N6)-threonylcarbamoyltransferase complex dimerization subunit type 1 TsaB [Candidatus Angelobacter sp.]